MNEDGSLSELAPQILEWKVESVGPRGIEFKLSLNNSLEISTGDNIDALAFKMKYKLQYGDPDIMARKRNIPAPGTYENVLQMDSAGRYQSS